MRRIIAVNSARIVQLVDFEKEPVAIYPDQVSAARIVGVSRQAISKALNTNQRVKGYLWMKLFDYDKMVKANIEAKRQKGVAL